MTAIPKGAGAVMASKRKRVSDGEPWKNFELFPTPPWGTRAFLRHVLPLVEDRPCGEMLAWDGCAGLGHMSQVLLEDFSAVFATDIFDYGFEPLDAVCDFRDAPAGIVADWIVMNPPFGTSLDLLQAALLRARRGVAFLLRLAWAETEGRDSAIFSGELRPTLAANFAERVAMCEGGWDPACDTATAYAWFVWRVENGRVVRLIDRPRMWAQFMIPYGQKAALTRDRDKQLATRCVAGWVPPSTIKKAGKGQSDFAGCGDRTMSENTENELRRNSVSGEMLRGFVERVERVREQKKQLGDDEKLILAEAKAGGFVHRNPAPRSEDKADEAEPISGGSGARRHVPVGAGHGSGAALFRAAGLMQVDIAAKEQVVEALKKFVPHNGAIVVEAGGKPLRLTRAADGSVSVSEVIEAKADKPASFSPDARPDTPDVDAAGAEELGRLAALDDVAIIKNPFPFGDPRRARWDLGWRRGAGNDGMGD